ncbi:hypothetical protein ACN9MJ_20500 [Acidovorax facilis]|uniref:hypothetical protein n=1 Tax=Acidovorax facilis TaxID=12917 RepID=UPI003CEF9C6B
MPDPSWAALAPIRAIGAGAPVPAPQGHCGGGFGSGGTDPEAGDPNAPRSPSQWLSALLRLNGSGLHAWVQSLPSPASQSAAPWYHQLDYTDRDTLLAHLAARLDAAHLAHFTCVTLLAQDLHRWGEHLVRSASDAVKLDLLKTLASSANPLPGALRAPLIGGLLGGLHGNTRALDAALHTLLPDPEAPAPAPALLRATVSALLPPSTPAHTPSDPGPLRQVLQACTSATHAPAKATLWALAIPVAASGAALPALAPALTRLLTSQTCAIVQALAQQHPDGQALARYLHALRSLQRTYEIRVIHRQLLQGFDGTEPVLAYLQYRNRRGAYPHATALGYCLGAWATVPAEAPGEVPGALAAQPPHTGLRDLWLGGAACAALGPAQSELMDQPIAEPPWQLRGPESACRDARQRVLQARADGLRPLLAAPATTHGGAAPPISRSHAL